MPEYIRFLQDFLEAKLVSKHDLEQEPVLPGITEQIEQAKREWRDAEAYFNNVCEPALIDHAILVREAAEKRYMFLLKEAKQIGAQAFLMEEQLKL